MGQKQISVNIKTQSHDKRIKEELEKRAKSDLYLLCEKEWSLLTQICRLPRQTTAVGGLNLSRGEGGGTSRALKARVSELDRSMLPREILKYIWFLK